MQDMTGIQLIASMVGAPCILVILVYGVQCLMRPKELELNLLIEKERTEREEKEREHEIKRTEMRMRHELAMMDAKVRLAEASGRAY